MPMTDWRHTYPQVQALVQGAAEALAYRPARLQPVRAGACVQAREARGASAAQRVHPEDDAGVGSVPDAPHQDPAGETLAGRAVMRGRACLRQNAGRVCASVTPRCVPWRPGRVSSARTHGSRPTHPVLSRPPLDISFASILQ
jgi:hypothetical protein